MLATNLDQVLELAQKVDVLVIKCFQCSFRAEHWVAFEYVGQLHFVWLLPEANFATIETLLVDAP
jgi:hypothetical protein